MGLFDFIKKSKEKNNSLDYSRETILRDMEKSPKLKNIASDIRATDELIKRDNIIIQETKKADEQYKIDKNLDKCILVYEKYCLSEDAFHLKNHCLRLANYYVKAKKNDIAWSYLNKLYLWEIKDGNHQDYILKIRYEQFKILRNEKRYKDAFSMLVEYYTISYYYYRQTSINIERFVKDVKTTAKGLGLSEMNIYDFINEFNTGLQRGTINPNNSRNFCILFFNKHKI